MGRSKTKNGGGGVAGVAGELLLLMIIIVLYYNPSTTRTSIVNEVHNDMAIDRPLPNKLPYLESALCKLVRQDASRP